VCVGRHFYLIGVKIDFNRLYTCHQSRPSAPTSGSVFGTEDRLGALSFGAIPASCSLRPSLSSTPVSARSPSNLKTCITRAYTPKATLPFLPMTAGYRLHPFSVLHCRTRVTFRFAIVGPHTGKNLTIYLTNTLQNSPVDEQLFYLHVLTKTIQRVPHSPPALLSYLESTTNCYATHCVTLFVSRYAAVSAKDIRGHRATLGTRQDTHVTIDRLRLRLLGGL
jgi:hypothetical protein